MGANENAPSVESGVVALLRCCERPLITSHSTEGAVAGAVGGQAPGVG